jgi:hypothetical protein
MNKVAIIAVVVGMLTFGIGSTASSAATSPLGDREELHLLTLNRALNGAFKVARRQCENNATGPMTGSVCFAFQAGPGCHSVFKHKLTCPIHLISGTPGNPALQTDCHRDAKILIKRATGLKLYFRFVNPYVCGSNVEHPVSAPRGALVGAL